MPLGHFLSYRTKQSREWARFPAFGPVTLADEFGSTPYIVLRPTGLLVPADKNGETVPDPVTHLREYRIRDVTSAAAAGAIYVRNQCSELLLDVGTPVSLLVPAAKSLLAPVPAPDPADHNVDHFLCYRAKAAPRDASGNRLPRLPRGTQVEIVDQFQSRRYDLKRITKLCYPVDKSADPQNPPAIRSGANRGEPKSIDPSVIRNPDDRLVCYGAKIARKLIPQDGCGCDAVASPRCRGTRFLQEQSRKTPTVRVNDQFGPDIVNVDLPVELCIPSWEFSP